MSMPVLGTILESGDVVLMARVTGADGDPVLTADVDTISYSVWKVGAPPGLTLSGSTTTPVNVTPDTDIADAADVMFDELQLGMWTVDDVGYNFRKIVPADEWPETELSAFNTRVWARCDVLFTMADGSKAIAQFWPELLPSLAGKST